MGMNEAATARRDHEVMLRRAAADEQHVTYVNSAFGLTQSRTRHEGQSFGDVAVAQAVAGRCHSLAAKGGQCCRHKPDAIETAGGIAPVQAEARSDQSFCGVGERLFFAGHELAVG
jgi:hypothetical protein